MGANCDIVLSRQFNGSTHPVRIAGVKAGRYVDGRYVADDLTVELHFIGAKRLSHVAIEVNSACRSGHVYVASPDIRLGLLPPGNRE